MTKEIRTICVERVPVLEIMKDQETITMMEVDDMNRQMTFPASVMPAIINHLEDLK